MERDRIYYMIREEQVTLDHQCNRILEPFLYSLYMYEFYDNVNQEAVLTIIANRCAPL